MVGNKSLGQRKKKIPVNMILIHLVLIFVVIVMNFPIFWMISTSLKDRTEVFISPPSLIPRSFNWNNYTEAWEWANWPRYFFNTAVMAIVPALAQILFGSLAAYAFTRKFKGSQILFTLFLGTMMIPGQTTLVPNYVILKELKWLNTYYALTVPFATSAFSVFLLRQYFLTIPKEYEDAAVIDGCGPFRYLFTILMPLSKSALSIVGILAFLDGWNSYLWPLIMTTKDHMRTVQVAVWTFQSEGGTIWPLLMAATTFVSLPAIILFLFLQKQLIEGVMMGGIKG